VSELNSQRQQEDLLKILFPLSLATKSATNARTRMSRKAIATFYGLYQQLPANYVKRWQETRNHLHLELRWRNLYSRNSL